MVGNKILDPSTQNNNDKPDNSLSAGDIPQAENLVSLIRLCTTIFSSPAEELKSYLEYGIGTLRADLAVVVKVSFIHENGAVVESVSRKDSVKLESDLVILDQSVLGEVVEHKTVLARSLDQDDNIGILDVKPSNLRGFVGAPAMIGGHFYGIVGFYSVSIDQFSKADKEIVEYLAKGVAKVIDMQKSPSARLIGAQSEFTTDGICSFEEYVALAKVPVVYGVAGRVIDVLQRRIGNSSLAIEYVAQDLNLSKRTLQRRLQQQELNFAQLRDQVRFNYAINLLVENVKSIDSISSCLDFSDRTSFTNAFKRWTNLSPSTFRKLFRDYA